MVQALHEIFTQFMSEDMASTIYLVSGVIFTLWYIPQFARLFKDTTGAAAMSLNTMFFQLLFRVPGLLFCIVANQEVSFWVIFLDTFARFLVFMLAMHKRISFHKSIMGNSGFFASLAPIDISNEVLDNEKQHLSKVTAASLSDSISRMNPNADPLDPIDDVPLEKK